MEFNRKDLDRHITGHYGEDQFDNLPDDEDQPNRCELCGEPGATYQHDDCPPEDGGFFCPDHAACDRRWEKQREEFEADHARWTLTEPDANLDARYGLTEDCEYPW